jgi:hypothetical protein
MQVEISYMAKRADFGGDGGRVLQGKLTFRNSYAEDLYVLGYVFDIEEVVIEGMRYVPAERADIKEKEVKTK